MKPRLAGSRQMDFFASGCALSNAKNSTSSCATFLSVFPQVSLWRDDFYSELPVVGCRQLAPKPLDLTRIHERALYFRTGAKTRSFQLHGVF